MHTPDSNPEKSREIANNESSLDSKAEKSEIETQKISTLTTI
jgi:hypothetical protein